MNINLKDLKLPEFLKIIMGVHLFIILFIAYGVYHDGKKSLTYPITRFQLLIIIGLIWISLYFLLDEYQIQREKKIKYNNK